MLVELKINCADFIEMLKKMAVPTSSGKDAFIYPIIHPMLRPGVQGGPGMLEWIVKDNVTTWVRFKYALETGLTEPVRIQIDVAEMLKMLKVFNSTDMITFIHDTEAGIDTLTDGTWDSATNITMPITFNSQPDLANVFEGFPAPLEPETEVIMLKNGTLKPDISGTLDTKFIEKVISNANIIDSKSKKKEDIPTIYNLKIDGDLHKIEAIAGDEFAREHNIIRNFTLKPDIQGSGDVHYTNYLGDVVGVLSGEFKFFTVTRGPMWIMQDTDKFKVRYLIPPAAQGTYK